MELKFSFAKQRKKLQKEFYFFYVIFVLIKQK